VWHSTVGFAYQNPTLGSFETWPSRRNWQEDILKTEAHYYWFSPAGCGVFHKLEVQYIAGFCSVQCSNFCFLEKKKREREMTRALFSGQTRPVDVPSCQMQLKAILRVTP
jgi:hypothetical protein